MKIYLKLILVVTILACVAMAYPQEKKRARKYISNAKAYYNKFGDEKLTQVKDRLIRAAKTDKSNPETYLLMSAFFYKIGDVPQGEKAFGRFKDIMDDLSGQSGGLYKVEYERVRQFTQIDVKDNNGFTDAQMEEIWVDISYEDPGEKCREDLRLVDSQLDKKLDKDAKRTLSSIASECKNQGGDIAGTVSYFQAIIFQRESDLIRAIEQINSTNSDVIISDYRSDYQRFKNQLSDQANREGQQILAECQASLDKEDWKSARSSLNRLIALRPVLNGTLQAKNYYNSALIYANNDKSNLAKQDLDKAEKLGYDEQKVAKLYLELSGGSKPFNMDKYDGMINKSIKFIDAGSYDQALTELNSYSNQIKKLPRENQKQYYILLCRCYIKKDNFLMAKTHIDNLERIKVSQKNIKKVFERYSGRYLSFWIARENTKQYAAISAYEDILNEKYLSTAHRKQVKNRLNALKPSIAGKTDIPIVSTTAVPEIIERSGKPFTLHLSSSTPMPVLVQRYRRTHYKGEDIPNGPITNTRMNQDIRLESGNRYYIDLQDEQAQSKNALYAGLALVSAALLLFYVR